jgi:ribosome biogenesis GTPase
LQNDLRRLGWDPVLEAASTALLDEGTVPGRVVVAHRGGWLVRTAFDDELRTEPAGRLRQAATGPLDLPTVGDWVAVRPSPGGGGLVVAVLPRRTALVRRRPGPVTEEQVLAANVDVALCCVSAGEGPRNARRLERYLTLAWDAGTTPVAVLTKADLCEDVEGAVAELGPAVAGVEVVVASSVTGDGIDALRALLPTGRTGVLLGPSGVGKSSIANRLLEDDHLDVGAVRDVDGRGRHTTTRRELTELPGGGLLIDTPGLREVGLWDGGGTDTTFADVHELAAACRFADCHHDGEPGCAVHAALAAGTLAGDRMDAFTKLRREEEWLARRKDARAASEHRRKVRSIERQRRKGR